MTTLYIAVIGTLFNGLNKYYDSARHRGEDRQ